jgi:hypothetical protein
MGRARHHNDENEIKESLSNVAKASRLAEDVLASWHEALEHVADKPTEALFTA